MAKTFFPHTNKTLLIKASPPHPENTEYKISIGLETWGEKNHEVVKIQMVYDGEIAGRRSPSYPLGTDDFERVVSKTKELIASR